MGSGVGMREGSGDKHLRSQPATAEPLPSHCPYIRICREGLRAKCENWHPLSRTEWSCLGGTAGTTAELGGIQNLEGERHKWLGQGYRDPCPCACAFSVSMHLTQPAT